MFAQASPYFAPTCDACDSHIQGRFSSSVFVGYVPRYTCKLCDQQFCKKCVVARAIVVDGVLRYQVQQHNIGAFNLSCTGPWYSPVASSIKRSPEPTPDQWDELRKDT